MKTFSLFFLLFISLMATQGFGATFTVNQITDQSDANLADNICDVDLATAGEQCSLRAAVQQANGLAGADTINFSPSLNGSTITVASFLGISQNLTINGLGANLLTISGGNSTRIFVIAPLVVVTMRDFTLANANFSGDGGAIRGEDGVNLTLERMYFNNNVATGFYGGLIMTNQTTLTISESTFDNNRARSCGAIGVSGTVTITNSTFSANQATGTVDALAGAICNFSFSMTIRSSTVTQNIGNGANGGGIYSSGTLNLGNTIVAANTGSQSYPDINNSFGTVTSAGFNLIGNNNDVQVTFPAGNPNVNNDIVGNAGTPVNPLLGPLQNNGGTTPTHAPLFTSPAIDRGSSFGLTIDQRGLLRPVDLANYANAADGADIGAVELQLAPTAATVSVSGRVTTLSGAAIIYVRLSLTDSQGNVRTTTTDSSGYYQFDDVQAGETYVLTATGKRFTFSQPVQVLNINEEANQVNFIANSEKRLRAF
jgi:hypothetical protein